MAASGVSLVLVLQGSKEDGDSVIALPVRLLRQVSRVALGVMLGRRNAPVDEDALQDGRWLAGSLSGIAVLEQLLSEEQGIQKCLVGPEDPGGLESVMANEVHVLVVDDDRRLQLLWQVTSQEKTPPVPEDGGELGVKYGTTPDFRLNSGQILQKIHLKRAATESYPQVCLERRGQERISRDSEGIDVGQKSLARKGSSWWPVGGSKRRPSDFQTLPLKSRPLRGVGIKGFSRAAAHRDSPRLTQTRKERAEVRAETEVLSTDHFMPSRLPLVAGRRGRSTAVSSR
jgi:hypothetical protein